MYAFYWIIVNKDTFFSFINSITHVHITYYILSLEIFKTYIVRYDYVIKDNNNICRFLDLVYFATSRVFTVVFGVLFLLL